MTTSTQSRAWNSQLARGQIEVRLSDAACDEALSLIEGMTAARPGDELPISEHVVPRLANEVEECRRRVDEGERMALIQPRGIASFESRRRFAWIVANLFGEPLVQNAEGARMVLVYARPGGGRIVDGARYHQTREGGAVHTDNVSGLDDLEYLIFSCMRPARIGGESILVNAFSIHGVLEEVPDALEILRRPFWWEGRGISESVFQAPIVTYDAAGEPRFRYLRRYLESAHRRAGEPLTPEQVWALDTLDAILDLSHLQFRTRLEAGEILVTRDSQVLHARTSFSDPFPGAPADAIDAATGSYRFFDRVWARKRTVPR